MQAWSLKPQVNLRAPRCVLRGHLIDQSWVLRCTQWWQYVCSEAIGNLFMHESNWSLMSMLYDIMHRRLVTGILIFSIVLTRKLCPMPPSINCRTAPMTVRPCAESRHSQELWKVLISRWLVGIACYGFSFLNIITWKKRLATEHRVWSLMCSCSHFLTKSEPKHYISLHFKHLPSSNSIHAWSRL